MFTAGSGSGCTLQYTASTLSVRTASKCMFGTHGYTQCTVVSLCACTLDRLGTLHSPTRQAQSLLPLT